MTTPNFEMVLLPETHIFKPRPIAGAGGGDMAVESSPRGTASNIVGLPVGVLVLQVQIDINATAGNIQLVQVGIGQDMGGGLARTVIDEHTDLGVGRYSAMYRVVVSDPKAFLYVAQRGFGTTAVNNARVGVTVFPTGQTT
ncbi:hypothetical protein QP866_06840 [Corynebacterium imitans]|uniref:hypothetical protein n=1 Tax=Corynebacterium imitans TaxID=156978 RepID=UPI00254A1022|nr:hypothetical protein [Corynebacterium imitans]MDK8637543.1 hypothetical protein [Corynebacterium imitans]MDK8772844.1 hypothetical protein [Corynebacterium imitans]